MSARADIEYREMDPVDAVTEILGDRSAEGLSLEQVAAILNMSPRTLQRRLDEDNSSFANIQATTRWYTAAIALVDAPSVANAGRLAGYSTASHFCHAFKAQFGVTPGLFRR